MTEDVEEIVREIWEDFSSFDVRGKTLNPLYSRKVIDKTAREQIFTAKTTNEAAMYFLMYLESHATIDILRTLLAILRETSKDHKRHKELADLLEHKLPKLEIKSPPVQGKTFTQRSQPLSVQSMSKPNNAGTMSLHTSEPGLDEPDNPQYLEYCNEIPSDIGLLGVLNKVSVWHSLAISLGVPVDKVQSLRSDQSLGGLLALQYWRDGRSGDLFPTTWRFLLQKLTACQGSTVADALEKEFRSNPAWSNMSTTQ